MTNNDSAGANVWLAERATSGPTHVFGIFSTPEKAAGVCQDDADDFFGPARTDRLSWIGDDSHRSASYRHPAAGTYVYLVTRSVVDLVTAAVTPEALAEVLPW